VLFAPEIRLLMLPVSRTDTQLRAQVCKKVGNSRNIFLNFLYYKSLNGTEEEYSGIFKEKNLFKRIRNNLKKCLLK
jgi:hypothetical protein